MATPTDDGAGSGGAANEPGTDEAPPAQPQPSAGARGIVVMGLLAIAAVGALVLWRPSGKPAPDTAATIEAEYASRRELSADDVRGFFRRFAAVGPDGAARAKELAARIVREIDPNDEPAHRALGHRRFEPTAKDVDAIAFRDYPYIRIVEYAIEQPWLDEDSYKIAQEAWEKTAAHIQRLQDDATFRAIDTARGEISRDPEFKDVRYEATFASPYLICYTSGERVTKDDLEKIGLKQRLETLSRSEAAAPESARRVTETSRILQQLYAEFLKRYQEPCGLKPLIDKDGGRPLVVWVFANRKAWDSVLNSNSVIAGYFSPSTGWVYFYLEDDNRQFEVNKTVHEATHQLEHWFQRQKRDGGRPVIPQSFFGEGFAEYIGAVSMAEDRTITFHGVNVPRLRYLKAMKEENAKQGKKPDVYMLKDLVGFTGYEGVRFRGSELGFRDPLGTFFAQSWALVYFLNEFASHKYQAKLNLFLNDRLMHPRIQAARDEEYGALQFRKRFEIRSYRDWLNLSAEFEKWYLNDLIPMDLSKFPGPPEREDWPGFEPLSPIDPRDPSTWGATRK